MTLAFLAPVPIGHRVKLVTYAKPKGRLASFFAGNSDLMRCCTIQDLETGIVYSPGWMWKSRYEEGVLVFDDELEKGVVETGSQTLQVVRCKVISCRGNAGNHRMLTKLVLDEL